MNLALEWIGFAVGIVLVLAVLRSVVTTLIVPRREKSALTRGVFTCVRVVFLGLARPARTYEGKDRILGLMGPVALLALWIAWLGGMVLGLGLILNLLTDLSLWRSLQEAGSSFFTLGFASTARPGPIAVDVVAGALGMMLVAILIAYLPTLYGAFNRRETPVTMLESRAGAPAWGPEILYRYHLVDLRDALPDLFTQWEAWSAEVAETHTTYSILIYLRSPRARNHWVVSILAVLDAAAMYLALDPGAPGKARARLCLRQGFTMLRDVADEMGVHYQADPDPDADIDVTVEMFSAACRRLDDVGFRMGRSPADAYPDFRGWRSNYEALAYELADRLVAPPGPWSGGRRHLPDLVLVPQRPLDRRPARPTPSDS